MRWINAGSLFSGFERIPERARRIIQYWLGVIVVVVGSLIWSWNYWIQNQTDGLTRYVRVDSWSVFQALFLFMDLKQALSAFEPGDRAAIEKIGQMIARSLAAYDLLPFNDRSDPLSLDRETFPEFGRQSPLVRLQTALLDEDVACCPVALIPPALLETGYLIDLLQKSAAELSTIRFELQDQDLAKAGWLIAANRLVLIVFYGFVGSLGLLLIAEALVARRSERRAVGSERRFRDISEVASDSIWETGSDGTLIFVTDQTTHPSNYALSIGLGRTLSELASVDMRQTGLRRVIQAMGKGEAFRDALVEMRHHTEGGSPRMVRWSGKPIFDGDGNLCGYRGVASDITDEVRREERIRYLAENDYLTKLPNRHKFQELLRDLQSTLDRRARALALFLIDLDGFKEINDTRGHHIGDLLLIRVAEYIQSQLDQDAVLARLGGDEFAILMTINIDSQPQLNDLAEQIIQALGQPFEIRGQSLSIGASAGIAIFPNDEDNHQDLLQAADLALFSAKQSKVTNVVRYSAQMTAELRKRREIAHDLRQAIDSGGLTLNFQPQICLRTGNLIGAEALVRWYHPEMGRVNTELFVAIAEERGMIRSLGRWVLKTACNEATRWPVGIVAVNISPDQFLQDDLVGLVRSTLRETGLSPSRLELEITEGALMKNEQEAIAILNQFRDMNIQLAIDDFGTGYSSLSYLKRFPVNKVKIDRSFVMDLDRDHDDQLIVKAILSLGQALGLKTIAEGIELEEHVKILERLGCDEGQGYYYGKPMAADMFCSIANKMMRGPLVAASTPASSTGQSSNLRLEPT